MKKKLLALFLTAAQLVAFAFTVNAATVENLNWDFEDYTLNSNYGIMQIKGNAGENDKIEPATITDKNGVSYDTSAKLTSTTDNMYFDANFANVEQYTDNYVFSIKYDMYTGDYNGNKALDLKINGFSTSHTNFIMVATNGTLKLNNAWGNKEVVPENTWNNFEARIYYGTRKAEIYLNGTKIKDVTLPAEVNTVNGFRFVNYKSESSSVMGVDNVTVKVFSKYDIETEKYTKDFENGIGAVSTQEGSIEAKGGIGCKAMSDKAAYFDSTNGISYFRYYPAATTTTLAEPYVYHLSFEWLIENYAKDTELNVYINNARKDNFIKYYGDGTMSIDSNNKTPLNRWLKYDLYFYCGTNKCDVYIDGVKKITLSTADTINYINGYGFVVRNGMKMAIDNIKLTIENTADNSFAYSNTISAKNYEFETISNISKAGAVDYEGNSIATNLTSKFDYAEDSLFKSETVSGIYGKEDKVYHLSNETGTYTVPENYSNEQEVSVTYPKAFSAGDKIRFSTTVLYSNLDTAKNITSYMNGVQRNDILMLAVSNGGKKVTAFNKALSGVEFKENTWYKLDYVITVAEKSKPNTADLYIDGKKVNTEAMTFFAHRTDETIPLTNLKVGMLLKPDSTLTNANGIYTAEAKSAEDMYVGDIYIDHNSADESFNSLDVQLVSADENIKVSGTKVIGVADIKVEDFLSAVTAEKAIVKVVDNSGKNITSGNLEDYNIVISGLGNGEIFAKTERINSDLYFFYNDFEDNTPTINQFINQNKQTPSYQSGVGLKNKDNNAVFFNMPAAETQPSVVLEYFTNGGSACELSKDLVLESSIYGPSAGGEFHVQAALNSNAVSSYVWFAKDGTIKFNNEVVGTWKSDRWYKTAVVFHKETGLADFYLNGVLVKEGSKIAATIDSLYRTKFVILGSTENAVSGGLDDLKLYEGTYDNTSEMVFVSGNSISDMDKVIFITNDMISADFELDYTVSGTAYIYENQSFENLAEVITDGSVLVIKSQNSDNIDYYEFVDVTKRTFVGTLRAVLDGNNLYECKNGTITATAYVGTTSPVTIFAAVYEGDRLVRVTSDGKSASGAVSTDVVIDKEKEQTLKIMVWDSVNGMASLSDSKFIGSNTDK